MFTDKPLAEWRQNLSAGLQAVKAAESDLAADTEAGEPTMLALLKALDQLSRLGLAEAYPVSAEPASLLAQVRTVLARVEKATAEAEWPQRPASATPATLRGWIAMLGSRVRVLMGQAMPVVPSINAAPDGGFAAAWQKNARPMDADSAQALAWMGQLGWVQPMLRDMHDILAFGRTRAAATPQLEVVQGPAAGTGPKRWIALAAPDAPLPEVSWTVVVHCPFAIEKPDALPLAGLLLDEWAEHLPGLGIIGGIDASVVSRRVQTAIAKNEPLPSALQPIVKDLVAAGRLLDEHGQAISHMPELQWENLPFEYAHVAHVASEVAGLSFRFDRPDAQAPQSVLLAVPPDPSRPWTVDTLLEIVRDTLELAKVRAVETRDLPRLTTQLPAIYADFLTRELPATEAPIEKFKPKGMKSAGSFPKAFAQIDEWDSLLPR